MNSAADPEAGGEDCGEVRAFFDQWSLYRKVADRNYLHHREAYAAIGRALDRFADPIRFLDLGAGDAAWTAKILRGRPLASYRAVDLSPVALELARGNMGGFPCPTTFTEGDFCEVLRKEHGTEDVVFVGLSLHHLSEAGKREILPRVRERVGEGGSFLYYEPIKHPGETRDAVLERWWTRVQSEWTELTPAEREAVRGHVFGSDHPESCATFALMAEEAGFRETRVLYADPSALYAVLESRAQPEAFRRRRSG